MRTGALVPEQRGHDGSYSPSSGCFSRLFFSWLLYERADKNTPSQPSHILHFRPSPQKARFFGCVSAKAAAFLASISRDAAEKAGTRHEPLGRLQKPTCWRPAGKRGAPFALCSGSAVVVGRGALSVRRLAGSFPVPLFRSACIPAFSTALGGCCLLFPLIVRVAAQCSQEIGRTSAPGTQKIALAGFPAYAPAMSRQNPAPAPPYVHAHVTRGLRPPCRQATPTPPTPRARPTNAPLTRRARPTDATHIACQNPRHPPTLRR